MVTGQIVRLLIITLIRQDTDTIDDDDTAIQDEQQ